MYRRRDASSSCLLSLRDQCVTSLPGRQRPDPAALHRDSCRTSRIRGGFFRGVRRRDDPGQRRLIFIKIRENEPAHAADCAENGIKIWERCKTAPFSMVTYASISFCVSSFNSLTKARALSFSPFSRCFSIFSMTRKSFLQKLTNSFVLSILCSFLRFPRYCLGKTDISYYIFIIISIF